MKRSSSAGASEASLYRERDGRTCDYCNTLRNRNETHIVQNEEGTIHQVGSTCVRDFLGGVSPEQISIESHGRTLTISGKRVVGTPAGGSFHRREREAGEFSRSLQLPDDLDPLRAEASCKHGILTVRIPKKEEAKPRQITVKAA